MINILNNHYDSVNHFCEETGLSLTFEPSITALLGHDRFNTWISLVINEHSANRTVVIGSELYTSLGDALLDFNITDISAEDAFNIVNTLPVKHPTLLKMIFNQEFNPDSLTLAPVPSSITIENMEFNNVNEARNTLGLSLFSIKVWHYIQDGSAGISDIIAAEINQNSDHCYVSGYIFDSHEALLKDFDVSSYALQLFKQTPMLIPEIAEHILSLSASEFAPIEIEFSNGMRFESFTALCKHLGIERKTLTYRLRKKNIHSMSYEEVEAIAKPKRMATSQGSLHAITVKDVPYESESEAARAWGISKQTAHARLNKLNRITQTDIDKAYTTPPTKYNKESDIKGHKFPDIEAIASHFDIDHRELQNKIIKAKAHCNFAKEAIVEMMLPSNQARMEVQTTLAF